MKIIMEVSRALDSSKFLAIDIHATQIISWWIPQLIETISACILLSEPSKDGNSQSMSTSQRTFQSFMTIYQQNLVITIYLLFGVYLLDSFEVIKSTTKSVSTRENELVESVQMHIETITESIRDCLEASMSQEYPEMISNAPMYGSDYKFASESVTWRTISSKLPHTFTSATYLFSLSIPDELRFHLALDGSSSRLSDVTNMVGRYYNSFISYSCSLFIMHSTPWIVLH